jgi:hypothetical protein
VVSGITFSQPAHKHVEDNRNNLPIPLYLRGKEITTKKPQNKKLKINQLRPTQTEKKNGIK